MLGLSIITPIQATEPKSANDMNLAMRDRFSIEEKYEEYLGEFTISHYCGCKECNGRWFNQPAKNGQEMVEGYTVAIDTDVIPLNTWIYIEGYGDYKAMDTGSAIKGNKIDVFIADHNKCLEMGIVKNVKVYMIEK